MNVLMSELDVLMKINVAIFIMILIMIVLIVMFWLLIERLRKFVEFLFDKRQDLINDINLDITEDQPLKIKKEKRIKKWSSYAKKLRKFQRKKKKRMGM